MRSKRSSALQCCDAAGTARETVSHNYEAYLHIMYRLFLSPETRNSMARHCIRSKSMSQNDCFKLSDMSIDTLPVILQNHRTSKGRKPTMIQ
jgi:hypothetical protein